MKYDLIIFDCDGTLVDSEYMHAAAAVDLFSDHGFDHYTPEKFLEHYSGIGLSPTLRAIEEKHKVAFPHDIADQYIKKANQKASESLGTAEGAHDVLSALQNQYKICVGSNGEYSTVLTSLKTTRLDIFFPDDHVFTASHVRSAKPAPDLFLYAAKQMDAKPEKTLVIEDTTTGIMAAKTAGMDVLGYTGLTHNPDNHAQKLQRANPTEVISRFIHIQGYLAGDKVLSAKD